MTVAVGMMIVIDDDWCTHSSAATSFNAMACNLPGFKEYYKKDRWMTKSKITMAMWVLHKSSPHKYQFLFAEVRIRLYIISYIQYYGMYLPGLVS